MTDLRIATYNIEWFTHLFDDQSQLLRDDAWSRRYNVTRQTQADAIAHVLTRMDVDAVMIIEAPDSHKNRNGVAALENFARAYNLRTSQALMGFVNETQQEIALLYDPAKLSARHAPIGPETGRRGRADAPRFDGTFRLDLDHDALPDTVRWSKPPLELALTVTNSDFSFRMIGVHAKSKAPHGAKGAQEIMRVSIENRRKQLAQCIWLRQRVDSHLSSGDSLIVLGDFNDGVGLDEYEALFGRSSIEIVLGEGQGPQLFDPHARQALSRKIGASPTTARFFVSHEKRWLNVLLDYIMVSRDLLSRRPTWRIWHPFEDDRCYRDDELRNALLNASDHFPVTLALQV